MLFQPTSTPSSLLEAPLPHHGIVMSGTCEAGRWVLSSVARVSMSSSVPSWVLWVVPLRAAVVGKVSHPAISSRYLLLTTYVGFSPDPYLSGVAVAQTVKGIQDVGIMACTKHYILNEQEHFRQAPEARSWGFNITESISSNIDDKTMHELYLW